MATPTDLSGMLYNDEDNLQARVSEWLARGDPPKDDKAARKPPKTPAVVKVTWRAMGASSEEELGRVPLSSLPSGPAVVTDAVERIVTDKLGPSPAGALRVRGWGSGYSASPGLDMTRTLVPGEMAYTSPGEALLRGRLDATERMVLELHGQLTATNVAALALIGEQSASLQQIATMRGSSSAVADNSSWGAVFGVGVLLFAAPFLRKIVEGNGNAEGSGAMVALRFRQMLDVWIDGAIPDQRPRPPRSARAPTPPRAALTDEQAASQEQAEAQAASAGGVFDIDAIVAKAKDDPEFAERLGRAAIEEEEILTAIGVPAPMIAMARSAIKAPT